MLNPFLFFLFFIFKLFSLFFFLFYFFFFLFLFSSFLQKLSLVFLNFSHTFIVFFIIKSFKCFSTFNTCKSPCISALTCTMFIYLLFFKCCEARFTSKSDHSTIVSILFIILKYDQRSKELSKEKIDFLALLTT